MQIFKKKKYITISSIANDDDNVNYDIPSFPNGVWIKCKSCQKIIHNKEYGNYKICPSCDWNFRLSAVERIAITCDNDSFSQLDTEIEQKNILEYPGYEKKLVDESEKTGQKDAVITGSCKINAHRTVICVMDSHFMMGSMGYIVGEKITRAFEFAIKESLPVIIFTASGGARMQEGIISLMQMAKVSAAIAKHSNEGLLYITVLTDPTTGGVTASFAMLGDIILAEPKALVGFAGPRVIQQTIQQKLPDGFQSSEFLLEHGFIDKIVPRKNIKTVLSDILRLHERNVLI